MPSKSSTRITMGYVVLAMTFIEGVITAFAPAFPFIAATSVQSGIYVIYVTGRTVTDNTWQKTQAPEAVVVRS